MSWRLKKEGGRNRGGKGVYIGTDATELRRGQGSEEDGVSRKSHTRLITVTGDNDCVVRGYFHWPNTQ